MGLADTLRNAAKTVFNAVGDIPKNFSYYAKVSTVYNVSAGAVNDQNSVYAVSGIFSKYKSFQIDNEKILPTDLKLLFPQSSLPVVPELHDRIELVEAGASVAYSVVDIKQDPVGAIWDLQLRKP